MQAQDEALPLGDAADVSLDDLVRASGLDRRHLIELVRYGALVPRDAAAVTLTFEARWVLVARRACRLSRELDLEPHAVSVALSLLDRIEALERELGRLRARIG
jgi:hypothetical protein